MSGYLASSVFRFPIPRQKGSDQNILKAPHSGRLPLPTGSWICPLTVLQPSQKRGTKEQLIAALSHDTYFRQKETGLIRAFNQLLIINIDTSAL